MIDAIVTKFQYKYKVKDLQILIWKQSPNGEIRPIMCCDWCRVLIVKRGFPASNIMTVSPYFCTNVPLYKLKLEKKLYTYGKYVMGYSDDRIAKITSKNSLTSAIDGFVGHGPGIALMKIHVKGAKNKVKRKQKQKKHARAHAHA